MEEILLFLLGFTNVLWYLYAKNSPRIIHAKALALRKVVNITVTQKDDVFYFHDLVSNMFVLQDTDYLKAVDRLKVLFNGSTVIISVLAEKFDGKSV
jgi:hypothetical protein